VTNVLGQDLKGTVTVWVKRDLVFNADGTFNDSLRNDIMVVTAEGTAPFVGQGDFQRANRAVRRLEARVTLQGGGGCQEDPLRQQSSTGFRQCLP
jgi:hypothetical protein